MVILNSLFKKENSQEKVIALGNFDGFHIGHMELVKKCEAISRDHNYESMVLSFKNNPLNFIRKDASIKYLMTNEEKIELLKDKIDYLLLLNFDEKILNIRPREFLDILKQNFNIKAIVTGFNFRFGYRNLGDNHFLHKFCKENGIKLEVVLPVIYNEKVVNSTYIRELLLSYGNVKLVNILLGRKFCITGKVVRGNKLGRTIGFPTANLQFDSQMATPLNGVYYTEVEILGKKFKSITSVGYNITVSTDKNIKIESYLFDFHHDIYGKNIKIYFLERIRDELKFNNINELKNQIQIDINYIHKTFYN